MMLLAFALRVFTQNPKDRGGASRRLYLLGLRLATSEMALPFPNLVLER